MRCRFRSRHEPFGDAHGTHTSFRPSFSPPCACLMNFCKRGRNPLPLWPGKKQKKWTLERRFAASSKWKLNNMGPQRFPLPICLLWKPASFLDGPDGVGLKGLAKQNFRVEKCIFWEHFRRVALQWIEARIAAWCSSGGLVCSCYSAVVSQRNVAGVRGRDGMRRLDRRHLAWNPLISSNSTLFNHLEEQIPLNFHQFYA